MTEHSWRRALDVYMLAADSPPGERRSVVESSSVDQELVDKVVAALEDDQWLDAPQCLEGDHSTNSPYRLGTRFGRYVVTALLGIGGASEVHAALDTELDRTVALKFFRQHTYPVLCTLERIIREAQITAALNHPNIVTVHEIVRLESDVAIAMELVEGVTLRKLCGNPLGPDKVIQIGRQIASALAFAHVRGIVHRDIKPENIMLRSDGCIKVLDFGVAYDASCNGTGSAATAAGTLSYMSPEQIHGEQVTGASDVFSLGLLLYELLTGKHPFAAESGFETACAIAAEVPLKPEARMTGVSELDLLLLTMLAKRPADRPSAALILKQLCELSSFSATYAAGTLNATSFLNEAPGPVPSSMAR